ncbi:MAG: hypothetical protein WCT31_05345, partial [Candidatus Micrarchaeia archaeon]
KDLKIDKEGRYDKTEVEKNLRQVSGAKRRLFELKSSIELENSRRGRELFDPNQIKEIYLISALLGDGEDFFSSVEIKDTNVIHTFTRDFTELVLNELDTVWDFTNYLKGKQDLIAHNDTMIINGGEKELLACYLTDGRNFDRLKSYDVLIIDEGMWDEYQKKPEYLAKKKADKISYGWDDIINKAHTGGIEYEKIARELARTNRFERRSLSDAFFKAQTKANEEKYNDHFRRFIPFGTTTYCFVFLDDPQLKIRMKLLRAICFVARGIFKQNKRVIGIATDMKIRPERSYELCLIDLPDWNETEQKEMEKLQKEFGILLNPQLKHVHEDEYPIISKFK